MSTDGALPTKHNRDLPMEILQQHHEVVVDTGCDPTGEDDLIATSATVRTPYLTRGPPLVFFTARLPGHEGGDGDFIATDAEAVEEHNQSTLRCGDGALQLNDAGPSVALVRRDGLRGPVSEAVRRRINENETRLRQHFFLSHAR